MSRVFIIPDIHLKPWIFDRAEEELSKSQYDSIVCLGDIVDDWGQELNLDLYRETFDRTFRFIERHPNILFCYGNHDISYFWEARETGYSDAAQGTVVEGISLMREKLPSGSFAFIHRMDDVLFSHAGLLEIFVSHFCPEHQGDLDDLLNRINTFGKEELWCDASPIWARPQDGGFELYPTGMLQVVGHTPVRETDYLNGLLSVDNFSTYRNGEPVGDQRYVWVDTVTKEWGFTDKDGVPEEVSDPKLDIRSYRIGDRVWFKIKESECDMEEIHEGYVEIIDRYPGGYATIDVMSERKGEKCLYKHIPLSVVTEHKRT